MNDPIDELDGLEQVARDPRVPTIARHFRGILEALNLDASDPNLIGTPERVARMYLEVFRGLEEGTRPVLTTFPNRERYSQIVSVRDIPFYSMCAHHFLPFFGHAHVAYLPGERILGLSKLARVVDLFARDLQVQERLTTQIASWLQRELEPKGVGVVLEAEHMCMSLRGVQKLGTKTVTSALQGLVRDDARTRQEFLALTTRSSDDQ